jgi:hypothetical protein
LRGYNRRVPALHAARSPVRIAIVHPVVPPRLICGLEAATR